MITTAAGGRLRMRGNAIILMEGFFRLDSVE